MSARRLFRSGLLLFVLLLASGVVLAIAAQDAGAITPHVKQIYKMDCAFCHGDNGNGKTDAATSMKLVMLDYTDPKSLEGKTDQQLFDIIRNGKGDQMPPEDTGRAKDDDVRGLVAYLRSMSKGGKQTTAGPAAPPASPNPNR
jgi:mono/diheme cytochrome c family protein